MRMHADEVDTDPSLVQRLVAGQFPQWAGLPVEPVLPLGTDNANYRLGADKLVRLPRLERTVEALERELEWLPRLAGDLPLAVPAPLGRGEPAEGFPFPWAVFTWLEGENVTVDEIVDPEQTATELAELLRAIRNLDATDAPPGLRRELHELDGWVREGAAKLVGRYEVEGLLAGWDEALTAPAWEGPPTWCHCDLDLRNLLFRDGRPCGVLDWGWTGVGDPASDAAVAWKVLPTEARDAFWTALGSDDAEIARARGWTLMQCAGALWYYTPENNPALYFEVERWLTEVLGSAPRRA
ncbi:MAG TPA: aminoglycoside phosphotransferase family protein [Gaiellaceae bacterium]|jgi:aminoglycoside phosphotransferase (APT) family kinase protein|nr:aminoglycoside phosphotransferase family protein [Gaiellaceae bacterium]